MITINQVRTELVISDRGDNDKRLSLKDIIDTDEVLEKKASKIILNEGLYVLNESLRDIVDVKIFVYTPFEIIKERWFARAASRGKIGKAAQMQFHDVNQTAFRYIRPTMEISDVVINGLTTHEYIEEVANKLIFAVTSVLKEAKQTANSI